MKFTHLLLAGASLLTVSTIALAQENPPPGYGPPPQQSYGPTPQGGGDGLGN